MRKLLYIGLMLSAVLAGATIGTGCGGGFEHDEAVAVCKDTQERQQGSIPDENFTQCVSCFEDCGRACRQLETFPLQFTCD